MEDEILRLRALNDTYIAHGTEELSTPSAALPELLDWAGQGLAGLERHPASEDDVVVRGAFSRSHNSSRLCR